MPTGHTRIFTLTTTAILLASIPLRPVPRQEANKMNANHAEQIAENARKSDAVAIAKVKSVGPSPQAWSGLLATYQEVQYQAVRWLKKPPNETKGDTIAVFHPLVANSLPADDHHPKLRESLFRVG